MTTASIALCSTLTLSIVLNIGLVYLARFLWISPSFGIAGQAAGWLKVWLTFGPCNWTYIDVDHLGDINGILTTPVQAGADRWNELMRGMLRLVRADDMFLIHGGDEFKIDRIICGEDGVSHTFRVMEWKAEELGLA